MRSFQNFALIHIYEGLFPCLQKYASVKIIVCEVDCLDWVENRAFYFGDYFVFFAGVEKDSHPIYESNSQNFARFAIF